MYKCAVRGTAAERMRRKRLFWAGADVGNRAKVEKSGGSMKIRNDRLGGLFHQDSAVKTVPADGQGFENLLTRQLGQDIDAEAPRPAVTGLNHGLEAMLFAAPAETQTSEDAGQLPDFLAQADTLLGAWDQYATDLASGQMSVKSAWGMLNGMDDRIRGLRGEMGKLGGQTGDLEAVINELEVLTVTEKFKLNRGDYQ